MSICLDLCWKSLYCFGPHILLLCLYPPPLVQKHTRFSPSQDLHTYAHTHTHDHTAKQTSQPQATAAHLESRTTKRRTIYFDTQGTQNPNTQTILMTTALRKMVYITHITSTSATRPVAAAHVRRLSAGGPPPAAASGGVSLLSFPTCI